MSRLISSVVFIAAVLFSVLCTTTNNRVTADEDALANNAAGAELMSSALDSEAFDTADCATAVKSSESEMSSDSREIEEAANEEEESMVSAAVDDFNISQEREEREGREDREGREERRERCPRRVTCRACRRYRRCRRCQRIRRCCRQIERAEQGGGGERR